MSLEDPDDLTDLAHRHLERIEVDGDPRDLRQAKKFYRRALAALPAEENPAGFLSNLGICLRLAYQEFGRRKDLREAHLVLTQSTRGGHPCQRRPMIILDDLALVLPDRAAVGTAVIELIEAVQLHERAAAMAHDADRDPNEWARYQNNVGGA